MSSLAAISSLNLRFHGVGHVRPPWLAGLVVVDRLCFISGSPWLSKPETIGGTSKSGSGQFDTPSQNNSAP